MARYEHKRWDVFGYSGLTTYISVGSNADKLVYGTESPECCMVSHSHVASQGGRIGHYYIVSYDTVVRQMAICHE